MSHVFNFKQNFVKTEIITKTLKFHEDSYVVI